MFSDSEMPEAHNPPSLEAYFVEFTKGYQPAKFQFCRLSRSSFAEGLLKHNNDLIMTSFHNFGI